MNDEMRVVFNNGAYAMQNKICAWLMVKQQFELAAQIVAIPLPGYQEPELMSIDRSEKS